MFEKRLILKFFLWLLSPFKGILEWLRFHKIRGLSRGWFLRFGKYTSRMEVFRDPVKSGQVGSCRIALGLGCLGCVSTFIGAAVSDVALSLQKENVFLMQDRGCELSSAGKVTRIATLFRPRLLIHLWHQSAGSVGVLSVRFCSGWPNFRSGLIIFWCIWTWSDSPSGSSWIGSLFFLMINVCALIFHGSVLDIFSVLTKLLRSNRRHYTTDSTVLLLMTELSGVSLWNYF